MREARIRVAKTILSLKLDRWIARDQLKAILKTYVNSPDAVQDKRVAALIRDVERIQTTQITPEYRRELVKRYFAPGYAQDETPNETFSRQIDPGMNEVKNAWDAMPNSQRDEMNMLFQSIMTAQLSGQKDFKQSYQQALNRLPPDSPNRKVMQIYVDEGMPEPHQRKRYRRMLSKTFRAQHPTFSNAEINALVDEHLAMIPESSQRRSLFERVFSLPGGCGLVVVYLVVIGFLGLGMLVLMGLLLVSSPGVLSATPVGRAIGSALLVFSIGTGIFLWLRRQMRSAVYIARLTVLVALGLVGVFLLVQFGVIDVDALTEQVVSDQEQALAFGITALSIAATVFLWVRHIAENILFLALIVIIGAGIALAIATGVIDLDVLLAGNDAATNGGFQ